MNVSPGVPASTRLSGAGLGRPATAVELSQAPGLFIHPFIAGLATAL